MNKKGIALVIAIIVLLGLSLMATAIMLTTQSEMKIGAAHKWYVEAMDVAQAGINEVIHRMKLSDTDANYIGDPNSPPDPDWEAVILNTASPPSAVGDTTFYSSVQDTTPILEYTDAAFTENALKIHYKHKGNQIYFYDQRHQREVLGDPSLIDVYYPIIMVEATGRYGTAKRKVSAEIVKYSISTNTSAGLAASAVSLNTLISILSERDLRVDSHVNKSTTPWWAVPSTEDPGDPYNNGNKTPEGDAIHWTYETNVAGDTELYHARRLDDSFHPKRNLEYDDECGHTGCIPGIVTPSLAGGGLVGVMSSNDLHVYGNPDIYLDANFTTPEIWEMLGFKTEGDMNDNITWTTVNTQASFESKLYSTPTDADNNDPQFIKVDNATTLNLKKYGRGVLWVTGDAEAAYVNGFFGGRKTFGWKGIVYISGDLELKGALGFFSNYENSWILGTCAVKGDVTASGTGAEVHTEITFYVIYSPTVINNVTESAAGRFIILNWREIK